jgi:hypothetical protein
VSIDFSKPVQTRDGRKVRILCTDGATEVDGKKYPIVGLFEEGGSLFPQVWGIDGSFRYEGLNSSDLTNVPPPKQKVKIEVRLYRNRSTGQVFPVAVDDPEMFRDGWLASTTVELEYEEQL